MRRHRLRPLAVRWVVIAAATSALVAVGHGPLAAPPDRLDAVDGWMRARPPDIVAMAVIRELAVGAGLYLLAVVTIALVGALAGHGPTIAAAARLSPRAFRPVLALATTVTLTAGVLGGSALAAGRPAPAPTMWKVTAGPSAPPTLWKVRPPATAATGPVATPGTTAPGTTAPGTTAPGTTAPPGPAAADPPAAGASTRGGHPGGPTQNPRGRRASAPPVRPSPVHRRSEPTSAARAARPGTDRYVVRPGDSFWSIAAARLAAADDGRTPSAAAVAAYWSVLVEANRSSLPVAGHPDLLFAGDRIVLPRR